eukprot:TRINITY_DN8263_c0_g1_i1.p1 TRINITY_DN8263_c0_g1~~TRINITY_DN8263_c0_g1_i1.p1  ORF type:complete len:269 (-),score=37.64 TRINITY_DN8263_c0_g1_i1:86-892(-)
MSREETRRRSFDNQTERRFTEFPSRSSNSPKKGREDKGKASREERRSSRENKDSSKIDTDKNVSNKDRDRRDRNGSSTRNSGRFEDSRRRSDEGRETKRSDRPEVEDRSTRVFRSVDRAPLRVEPRNSTFRLGPDRRSKHENRRSRPYPSSRRDKSGNRRSTDTEDPLVVPRQGYYFEHDDRDGSYESRTRRYNDRRSSHLDHYSPKRQAPNDDKWTHDKFDEIKEKIKSRKEREGNHEYHYNKLESDNILRKDNSSSGATDMANTEN